MKTETKIVMICLPVAFILGAYIGDTISGNFWVKSTIQCVLYLTLIGICLLISRKNKKDK